MQQSVLNIIDPIGPLLPEGYQTNWNDVVNAPKASLITVMAAYTVAPSAPVTWTWSTPDGNTWAITVSDWFFAYEMPVNEFAMTLDYPGGILKFTGTTYEQMSQLIEVLISERVVAPEQVTIPAFGPSYKVTSRPSVRRVPTTQDQLREQWEALATEDLGQLPKEALIASIRDLARTLLDFTPSESSPEA